MSFKPDKTLLIRTLYTKNSNKAWLFFIIYMYANIFLTNWTFARTPEGDTFCGMLCLYSRGSNVKDIKLRLVFLKHCCLLFEQYIRVQHLNYLYCWNTLAWNIRDTTMLEKFRWIFLAWIFWQTFNIFSCIVKVKLIIMSWKVAYVSLNNVIVKTLWV